MLRLKAVFRNFRDFQLIKTQILTRYFFKNQQLFEIKRSWLYAKKGLIQRTILHFGLEQMILALFGMVIVLVLGLAT